MTYTCALVQVTIHIRKLCTPVQRCAMPLLSLLYCIPFRHRCRSWQIFGGAKIFARFSPNLPEKFSGHFLWEYFLPHRSWRPFLGWPPKNVFIMIPQTLGAIFSNQTPLGVIFAHISGSLPRFSDFANIFINFAQIFTDFSRIFEKSKVLGCDYVPPPTPLP